jgi:hypothetical protein
LKIDTEQLRPAVRMLNRTLMVQVAIVLHHLTVLTLMLLLLVVMIHLTVLIRILLLAVAVIHLMVLILIQAKLWHSENI